MRRTISAFILVGILLMTAAGGFLVVNGLDEHIRPEALALADVTGDSLSAEKNAYFALVGFIVPEDDSPHARGIVLADTINDQLASNDGRPTEIEAMLGPGHLSFVGEWHKLCDATRESCLTDYGQHEQMISELTLDNRILLERYRELYSFSAFKEVIRPSVFAPTIYFPYREHRLILAEIGLLAGRGKISDALRALHPDTGFWRRVMNGSRDLISRISATAYVTENLRLLSEIIAVADFDAQSAQLVQEMLRPLEGSELSIALPLRAEFAMNKDMLVNVGSLRRSARDRSLAGARSEFLYFWPLYQPNATVNIAYSHYQPLVELASFPARELPKYIAAFRASQNEISSKRSVWHYVYNPVGKILTDIGTANFVSYMGRGHNLDGFIRLVSLQLMIKQQAIADKHVDEWLSGSTYVNPYTGDPMGWDSESRSLYFAGIGGTSSAQVLSKRIEVGL